MLDKYLEKLVFKIRDINSEYEQINATPKSDIISPELKGIGEKLSILRRDVNDVHSMILLRNAAKILPKKNRLVFIGTGQLNENVLHAYLHFQRELKSGNIDFDGDVLFVAMAELEYKFVQSFGYPCEKWQYQPELSYYLLQTKAVVLSSHLWSIWGDNLLSHCVSNAIKIQLWHGLPAKTIACSVINNSMEYHHFVSLLEDSVSVDHICIQNDHSDVIAEYARAFPCAKQHVTGDCRSEIIFNKEYQREFLKHKENKTLINWLNKNKNDKKVLYTPTFRDSKDGNDELYNKLLELIDSLSKVGVKLAIKLHVAINFTKEKRKVLSLLCEKFGYILIDDLDEVYSVFNEFDGMITDYSSIRVDFALTGKPIFLWKFDAETYKRKTDVIDLFVQLDQCSYELHSDSILDLLVNDPKMAQRHEFVQKNLKFSEGNTVDRTIKVFLDVMKSI